MTEDHSLSDLQTAVMRVLWERDGATAADVHAIIGPERGLAPTTVATVLSRLEKRGLVSHDTRGRQYLYHATVSEGEVRRSMVAALTQRLFDGDPCALVSHLIRSRDMDPDDLRRVRELLAAAGDEEADDDDA